MSFRIYPEADPAHGWSKAHAAELSKGEFTDTVSALRAAYNKRDEAQAEINAAKSKMEPYRLVNVETERADAIWRTDPEKDKIKWMADAQRGANADSTGNAKPTNPKDAVGSVKAPLSTVPSPFLQALGVAMLEGALKYGRHNYRPAGVRASVYYDAAVNRHALPWWEGEDIDPDSLLNHLVKAGACFAVLYDSIVMGNWVDDRPVRNPNFRKHFDEMNRLTQALIDKYPEPKEPFTEVEGALREREPIRTEPNW